MRFAFTILSILTALTTATAQKEDLDYINSYQFEPDGPIRGIGLIEIDWERDYLGKDLIIYDSKGKPKITIRVTDSDVTTKLGDKSFSRNNDANPFNPRLFGDNPDYFRLIFDCTKSTNKYYEVVVNQNTNETGLIKRADSLFKFETVIEYVNDWISLGLDFDRIENPLRQEPSDNAAIILNDDLKKYKIWRAEKIEMKGDWIKIKTRDNEEGWIRWRLYDQIIIKLYFAC
ncbi:MAG: hypothetical protein HYZ44_04705 [Bacteroidetes bacterium]|nr:hypothetical protein [Bacteroidota bacterium]